MNTIAITGATGFLGNHVIAKLGSLTEVKVRALTRKKLSPSTPFSNVVFVQGDMSDSKALHSLIEPGATLINLAFSNTSTTEDAIALTEKLIEACAVNGAKRLIHCSSISVYGRVNGIVNENTVCMPPDEYGKTKLAIEKTLLDKTQGRFELIILRPSEIFGIGGKALITLLQSLTMRSSLFNYMRSTLFGKRRTHLVPVGILADAIHFFCTDERRYVAEIFNVTADDQPLNQFNYVEQLLRQELRLPHYWLPVLPVPNIVLKSVLLISKRATIDQQVIYTSEKLVKHGFCARYDLSTELRKLASAYRDNKVMSKIV
ncbi:NAD-dependent epimerase/dehydratase family protein [Methylotenera sp. N17]|uniref:NAD-dependent epimerase/dehydratase family protein n=1 Tax=Methylotenera sp. N17 TaxID=1502761 RepID=UPI0006488034|nr:NAD-dependent epimerase/dehydratase family protein [Methylotenera sp. N17]